MRTDDDMAAERAAAGGFPPPVGERVSAVDPTSRVGDVTFEPTGPLSAGERSDLDYLRHAAGRRDLTAEERAELRGLAERESAFADAMPAEVAAAPEPVDQLDVVPRGTVDAEGNWRPG